MPTETNNKNVTLDQLKKSLTRAKAESDKAISAINPSGGQNATDEEVDAMLNEVFGTSDGGETDGESTGENSGSDEGTEA